MLVMFGQVLGVYEDIVDLDDDESLKELPEYIIRGHTSMMSAVDPSSTMNV